MPLVSILIPSYNHARFMQACLATVRSQTFQDWEVILLDDGSTDDSVEIAQRLADQDQRIKVYRNSQNLGTYGTEQRALDMSSGPYVAILNSDDLWHPEKLQKQVDQLDNNKSLPLSYTLGAVVGSDGEVCADESPHAYWPTTPEQDVMGYLVFENRVLASSVLFRRRGLYFETSLRYSGDWVALLERACTPIGCIPEQLTSWRIHGNNTFTLSDNQMLEEIRVRRAIYEQRELFLRGAVNPKHVEAGITRNVLNLVACHLFFGDRVGARRWGLILLRRTRAYWSLKRALVPFLPTEQAMRRLWRHETKVRSRENIETCVKHIRALPALHFRKVDSSSD
jgi:glycosyltransferase involved in cell wall biosynthesis